MRIVRKILPASATGTLNISPGNRQYYDTEFNEYYPDFVKQNPFKLWLEYQVMNPVTKEYSNVTSYSGFKLYEWSDSNTWVEVANNSNGVIINAPKGEATIARNNLTSKLVRKFKVEADIQHPNDPNKIAVKVVHETEIVLDIRSNAALNIKREYPTGQKINVFNKLPFNPNEGQYGYKIKAPLYKGDIIRPYTYYWWYKNTTSGWEEITTANNKGYHGIHSYELSIPYGLLVKKNEFKVIASPAQNLNGLNLLPEISTFTGSVVATTKDLSGKIYIFDEGDDILFNVKNASGKILKVYIQAFNDNNTSVLKTTSTDITNNTTGVAKMKIPANVRYVICGIDGGSTNIGSYNMQECKLEFGTTPTTYTKTLPEGAIKPNLATSTKFEMISNIVKEYPKITTIISADSAGQLPVGTEYYRAKCQINTSVGTVINPEYDYSFKWTSKDASQVETIVGYGTKICNPFTTDIDLLCDVQEGLHNANYIIYPDGISQHVKNATAVTGILNVANNSYITLEMQYIQNKISPTENIFSVDDGNKGIYMSGGGLIFCYYSTTKKEIQLNDPRLINGDLIDIKFKIELSNSVYKFYYSLFGAPYTEITTASTKTFPSNSINLLKMGMSGDNVSYLKFVNGASSTPYHFYNFDPDLGDEEFDFSISLKDKNADGTIKTTDAIHLQTVNVIQTALENIETGFFRPL